jgi:uncharacterized protein involved in type VI secretion and phage assembly
MIPEQPHGRALAGNAVIGLVTNNVDPDGLSRVKVKLPSISESDESYWARIAVPMAGNDRGVYFPLAVNDEVLVIFGALREPFVIGALWNGQDKAPADDANVHVIKSRAGHVITLDDTGGSERIEIVDASGNNRIAIDTASNGVTIEADGDIALRAPNGTITLASKAVVVNASDKGEVSAGSGGMKLHSDGDVFVTGHTVNLN